MVTGSGCGALYAHLVQLPVNAAMPPCAEGAGDSSQQSGGRAVTFVAVLLSNSCPSHIVFHVFDNGCQHALCCFHARLPYYPFAISLSYVAAKTTPTTHSSCVAPKGRLPYSACRQTQRLCRNTRFPMTRDP